MESIRIAKNVEVKNGKRNATPVLNQEPGNALHANKQKTLNRMDRIVLLVQVFKPIVNHVKDNMQHDGVLHLMDI
uniref:Uncharacterized protein n=1 Tax=Pithovirus LCPAC304 TaxID=2506594 RepID=A0A481Z9N6_9VIRU|nr:MAG: hypothetical protein LCPAC304_01370 [Pithovirus LCPAC304]